MAVSFTAEIVYCRCFHAGVPKVSDCQAVHVDDVNHDVAPLPTGDALVLFLRGDGDDATPVLEAAAKSIDEILEGDTFHDSSNGLVSWVTRHGVKIKADHDMDPMVCIDSYPLAPLLAGKSGAKRHRIKSHVVVDSPLLVNACVILRA